MTDTRAAELISENLNAIYGYAFARLYDKSQVEDLASEIVCEILTSAKRLEKEEAFWGFAWRVAENTFRKFIRREELRKRAEQAAWQDEIGGYECSPAQEYAEREECDERLYRLRRELSLLSKTNREVCVAYYVDNKSCSQIAKEQNISLDMVKYHLFKTRKLLKEGIGMTRKLGEKSYNPGTFRLNFWGDRNHYSGLCDRKLPGSILLAAYYVPMTAEALSLELGVAMPYLEDELQILEAAGLLLKVGDKYQTNLVIITAEYEKEFERQTTSVYADVANRIFTQTCELLPHIRALNFRGNTYDDNRLLFAVLNIAMVNSYGKAREVSPMGAAAKLPLGGYGWLFGHDNDFANLRFYGVCMEVWNKQANAWFSAENYRAIAACQRYEHSCFSEKAEAMCDAVLQKSADRSNESLPWLIENGFILSQDGKLDANFPVFEQSVYDKLCELLSPVIEMVTECMIDISDRAAKLLAMHAPAAVKAQCADIAKIHHRLAVAAFLLEHLIAEGKLTVPSEKTPLCVFGVKA